MNLQILPLAITMMAGPQIMSAIIFVTHGEPIKKNYLGRETAEPLKWLGQLMAAVQRRRS